MNSSKWIVANYWPCNRQGASNKWLAETRHTEHRNKGRFLRLVLTGNVGNTVLVRAFTRIPAITRPNGSTWSISGNAIKHRSSSTRVTEPLALPSRFEKLTIRRKYLQKKRSRSLKHRIHSSAIAYTGIYKMLRIYDEWWNRRRYL